MRQEVNFGKMIHGGDYNPEQWLDMPEILEKDIEYFKKAKINEVSLGIFAWAKLEPEEGVFDFDWMEKIIDRLYENGISTMLATPSGARPNGWRTSIRRFCGWRRTVPETCSGHGTIIAIPPRYIGKKYGSSIKNWQKSSEILQA